MATAGQKKKIRMLQRQLAQQTRELQEISQRSDNDSRNHETLAVRARCRDIDTRLRELTRFRGTHRSLDGGDSDIS